MSDFFSPQSIAVIGASKNKAKLGFQLLKNLIDSGFSGPIFPVNLEEKVILGLKTYANILDIHAPVDLAVIIVPREAVPMVLRQCVHKAVKDVLIISAGFAEKDSLGKKLQAEIGKITADSPTQIIGPNCLGIINTQNKMNLTFAASNVGKGGIGLVLQSGAIGAAIFDWAKEKDLGISKFVSLGNKVEVTEIEAIKILGEDPATLVIGLYLEEITDPAAFLKVCRKITRKKPVVVLKGGETSRGAKAASSHTAALASSNSLDEALFTQANIIHARDYSEFLNLLELLTCKVFDAGKKLAVVTNAGGPGILAADAATRAGFELPGPTLSLRRGLEKGLGSFASLDNPFDLGGDAPAESYETIIRALEKSPTYSSILAIITPQTMTEIEKTAKVLTTYRKSPWPVVASLMGGQKIKPAVKILSEAGIAHFDDPALAINLLSKIHRYFEKRENKSETIKIVATETYRLMDEQALIKKYKIPFVETSYVTTDSETMAFVEEHGFPVAFKTNREIKHKGRSGKVGLNIADNSTLISATHAIGYPAIVQKMVDSPYEILIGARRDPVFGIVLLFGKGGIFVEEESDISMKILPLTDADITEMIEQVRYWQTIKRYKVREPIKKCLWAVATLIKENPDISSIEFNPFKILKNRIIGVDVHLERTDG